MKLKKLRIAKAKRTAMGRFVCRLLGDECGAVAMEYVVIGLLVIAAAVGAAVYFGRAIAGGMQENANIITKTGDTIEKRTSDAKKNLNKIGQDGRKTNTTVQKTMIGTSNPE